MKKSILLILFFALSYGQKLELTADNYLPVVFEVENKNASEIYSKAKDWIQTYYKNPMKVLKADITNEMIRIEGFSENAFKNRSGAFGSTLGASYTLEIEFKDNKYRFTYKVNDFYAGEQRATYSYRYFFKPDGSVKKSQEYSVLTLNETVNNTASSLYDYITEKTKKIKNDW